MSIDVPTIEYEEVPMSELADLVWTASKSVCQVETLDSYAVAHEDGAYQAFLRGEEPSSEDLKVCVTWFDHVKKAVQRGVDVRRLHLLPDQLGDYLRYEIDYGYRKWCIPSGERVFTLKKSANPNLAKKAFRDFYVIDDEKVLTPEYTSQNAYVGLSKVTNADGINYFVALKTELLRAGQPLV